MTVARGALPLLTLDFDGVICSPFFGWNLGIHREFLDPDAAPPRANVPPRWLSVIVDHARFDLRRPLPDARAGLEALAKRRRLVVLTGRRTSPLPWLRRHGLDEHIDSVVLNTGPLRSPHFKLFELQRLRPEAHVDDDPRTAQLLATAGYAVYLRDWPRNRGLEYHPRVRRIASLPELTSVLSEVDAR